MQAFTHPDISGICRPTSLQETSFVAPSYKDIDVYWFFVALTTPLQYSVEWL
jgi:hypothetical protein